MTFHIVEIRSVFNENSSSFPAITVFALLVMLVAVLGASPVHAEINHHNNVTVSYTCGMYSVSADYIGGSGNRVVTVKEDADGGGPLGYVEVARYTFYGVSESLGFYTKSGSLPVNIKIKVQMYLDDDKNGIPDGGSVDTDEKSVNASNTCTPTATYTSTPVPPTATYTSTPVPPTATHTNTPLPPTATYTSTPLPPTATHTNTPLPPTATHTSTPLPPTATYTSTPLPPTATHTNTPLPPTATHTNTPLPPTATYTNTPVPPTATSTAIAPQYAQFGDRVWIESDGDGLANTGLITPAVGVIISMVDVNGVITHTTTDANGYYSFTVLAGTYTVKYGAVPSEYGPVVPSVVACSQNEIGNAGTYMEPANPDCTHNWGVTVTLQPGQANWKVDFAFHPATATDLPWTGEPLMSEFVYLPLITK